MKRAFILALLLALNIRSNAQGTISINWFDLQLTQAGVSVVILSQPGGSPAYLLRPSGSDSFDVFSPSAGTTQEYSSTTPFSWNYEDGSHLGIISSANTLIYGSENLTTGDFSLTGTYPDFSLSPAIVPEPSTNVFFCLGLALVLLTYKKGRARFMRLARNISHQLSRGLSVPSRFCLWLCGSAVAYLTQLLTIASHGPVVAGERNEL